MRPRFFATSALLTTLFLLPSGRLVAGPGSVFGTNLIVNGDAESGVGSTDGGVVSSIPGWTPSGTFTVVQYNSGGGFPGNSDPGPANRGSNFFAGGPGAGNASGSQMIDVSSGATRINAGNTSFDLTGYLGGFSDQRDNAVLTATFFGATGGPLGSAVIGPVTNDQRNDQTGLLFQELTGIVPVGTVEIGINLEMNHLDGDYNDGYADNLSLVLGTAAVPVPEPTGLALAGLAVSGWAWRTWRKRRVA
jgi:hypothetical protein